jgi:hypothetical protein
MRLHKALRNWVLVIRESLRYIGNDFALAFALAVVAEEFIKVIGG